MATEIRHYQTDSEGGYIGRIKHNWNAVFGQAYERAKQDIFDSLVAEPDAAWNGKRTENVTGGHEFFERNAFKRFKDWQGIRDYHWDFEIEVIPMD
ncbi:hypothetical protein MW887_010277 [Aspergillus wentii]|nr:hypothetical protein MW887_010277 [Aspergillus wentii]